jgi:hypothetical protein
MSNHLAKQEHSRPRATIQVNVTLDSSFCACNRTVRCFC